MTKIIKSTKITILRSVTSLNNYLIGEAQYA